MGLRRKAVAPLTEFNVIVEKLAELEKTVNRIVQAGPSSMQSDAWQDGLDPFPWEVMINWPGGHHAALPADNVVYYHPGRIDPITGEEVEAGWKSFAGPGVHSIKLFDDQKLNKVVTDGKFRFPIHRSLDETKIRNVIAFQGTTGSGATTIQIQNQTRGFNILSSALSIGSGDRISAYGAIDEGGATDNPRNKVYENDWIYINVSAVGAGSRGLGVHIEFA